MSARHPWRFFRAGGFDQVRLDSGADLLALGDLDQKLWVALACPTTTIDIDARTLALLDTDNDKKVRANELIAACRWTGSVLKNADDLLKGASELPLAAINTDGAEGKSLADAARRILSALGKGDSPAVTVVEASDALKALYASPINGDGVIVEATAPTEELKSVIRDIGACLGTAPDRSGTAGISQKTIDQFFSDAADYLAWHAEGSNVGSLSNTADARKQLSALQPKVADFFARCRLAAFDPRAATAMNRDDKDYLALSSKELTVSAQEIAAFPLARIEAGRTLPLRTGLNPAWEAQVVKLADSVVEPLLGKKDALTEAEWTELEARFAPFDAWQARKKGAAVEKLGVDRLKALVSGNAREELRKLVEEDLAIEPVAKAVASLEKLVRFHRDLYKLANNFVSFRDFYSRKEKAAFQAGRLYIDQRSCDLCIRVDDANKHATMAPLARTYLVYCECQREGKKMTIAAAFTAGDSDNLMVGRNGVFYDREGKDWDATITKIVDNPISVKQAFWAPYKKVIRFIEEQVAKRASDADAAANTRMTGAASELGTAVETGKTTEAKPRIDLGMVAALGVAVGGLTAALGAMMQAFFGLGIWMPLGLIALLFAISGPSMAVAWLKLRQRNLAPLLDANGWAMNSPARINIPFGGSLTQLAVLPPGAARDLRDPYAEKSTPWPAYAAAAGFLILGFFWFSGRADPFLPENARRSHVFAKSAPAAQAEVKQAVTPPPSAVTKQGGP
ncbi:MAG TPA: hypothetical protein VK447_13120 [Myxococcaceae bacterium]|nr:hypothetical protein [Myxococcaceae bacterium]